MDPNLERVVHIAKEGHQPAPATSLVSVRLNGHPSWAPRRYCGRFVDEVSNLVNAVWDWFLSGRETSGWSSLVVVGRLRDHCREHHNLATDLSASRPPEAGLALG